MMEFIENFFAQLCNQTFDWPDLAVIGLLVLLEGVLSIDNALVLGLLAKRLPRHQRAKALSYGIIGAFVFRTIAVLTAAYLLQWTFVKFLGGAYLVYIAVKHLFFEAQEEKAEKIVLDDFGNPLLVDAETGQPITPAQEEIEIKERVLFDGLVEEPKPFKGPAAAPKESAADWWRFWKTVGVIELTDIAFAVDSILAAIALAGGRQQKLWVIILGGILGMILMRFAAAIFIRLLDRFPRFEIAAYLLVIVIGMKLLVDWGVNSDWSFAKQPWIAGRLGEWKQKFGELEQSRRDLIHDYDAWLKEYWIFDVQHEHPEAAQEPPKEGEILAPHVPHLLDFHDLRFPECMAFWIVMGVCFAIGFWPVRKTGPPEQTRK
jgi:predicted tellurium resistance membrane protein TerC